jgi:hypothetical protein
MMQPTQLWHFTDQANLRPLGRPRHRAIHVQRPVRAPMMVILEVLGQQPSEMSRVQDEHVVQALAMDAPDEPLDIRILPWAVRGDQDLFDAHVPDALSKGRAVDAAPIAQQIAWRFVPRKRLHHLLSCSPRRRVVRDVDTHHPPAFVGQDH